MKKTILNESSSLLIVNRIMALTPGSKGIWGTMTANEMMFHCAKINREILKGKNSANKPNLEAAFAWIAGFTSNERFAKRH